MNPTILSAFVDELVKIALPMGNFALAGRRAIVSEGARGAGNLGKVLHQGQQFSQASRAAEAAHHAKLEKMLQSGAFNPATHDASTFMRSGQVIPKKAPTPMPAARPTESATKVLPRPEGTAVVTPQQRAATPMPAAAKPAPTQAAAPARPVTRGPPAVVKPGMFSQPKTTAPAQGWSKWAPHAGIGLGAAGLGYEAASP
jgi:hypothetical protein